MGEGSWKVGDRKRARSESAVRSAGVVEDPAAACPQAQWLGIRCDGSFLAKLLRLAFQAQSRSVRRFDRRLPAPCLISDLVR